MKMLQVKMPSIILILDIQFTHFESGRDLNSKVAINLGWSVIFNHNTLIGFTLTRLISIQPAQVTFDPQHKL